MTGSATIQDRFDITVLSPRGTARLRRTALPARCRWAARCRYSLLSPAERLQVGRAALAMRFSTREAGLDSQRRGRLAAGARRAARRKLWTSSSFGAEHRRRRRQPGAGRDRGQDGAARRQGRRDIGVPPSRSASCTGPRPPACCSSSEPRCGSRRPRLHRPAAGGGLTVRFAAGADRAESRSRRGRRGRGAARPAARLMPPRQAARPGPARLVADRQRARDLRQRVTGAVRRRSGSPVQWFSTDRPGWPRDRPVPRRVPVRCGRLHRRPAARLREQFVPAIENCCPRPGKRGSPISS